MNKTQQIHKAMKKAKSTAGAYLTKAEIRFDTFKRTYYGMVLFAMIIYMIIFGYTLFLLRYL